MPQSAKPAFFRRYARIRRVLKHHALACCQTEALCCFEINVRLVLGHAHILDGEHELEIFHHVAVDERLLRVAACRQRSDGHFDAACAQTSRKSITPSLGFAIVS